MTIERRKSQRIDYQNLLTYVGVDENNHERKQGMGRTLNVSEGGILLETRAPFIPKETVFLTIRLEEELLEMKGKVIFCNKREAGNFESGIQFVETHEEKLRFLKQFIELFKGKDKDS